MKRKVQFLHLKLRLVLKLGLALPQNIQKIKKKPSDHADFKYKSLLGNGRCGKTRLCEFCGRMIALKSADLSKVPLNILREMQNELKSMEFLLTFRGNVFQN